MINAMHPVLAVFLTGFLVVAAYSSSNQLARVQSQLAATGDTSTQINANNKLQANYKTDAANKKCPAASGTNVYRSDKPRNSNFTEAGKIYTNLYGKPCESDYVKAFCSAENKCNGAISGSKCFDGLMWRDCKIGDPHVEAVKVADLNNSGTNLSGQQDRPIQQPQSGANQFNTAQTSQPVQNQTGVGDAYKTQTTPGNQNPTANPSTAVSNTGQLNNIANTPTQTQQSGATQFNQAGTGQVTQQAQGNLTPTVQPTTNNPTRVATNQTNPNPSAQNTFRTGANTAGNTGSSASTRGSSGSTGATGNTGSTGSTGSKSNSFSSGVRNAFTGGLNGYSIVSGITNFVSGLISGSSSGNSGSSQRVQTNQNVQPTRAVTNSQSQTNVASNQTNNSAQQTNMSGNIQYDYRTPQVNADNGYNPLGSLSSFDVGEIANIATTPDYQNDTEDISDASPDSPTAVAPSIDTRALFQRIESGEGRATIVIEGVQQTYASTTALEVKQEFVSRISRLAAQEVTGSQNSFASSQPVQQSRTFIDVFHAVSIPTILDTIAKGSVDFILSFIRDSAPENNVVYTERDDLPVAPITSGDAPMLPGGNADTRTGASAQVAQNAPEGNIARQAQPVAYGDRLRETPVAVFADTSPTHRDSTYVPTHRPLATFEVLPIPERSAHVIAENPVQKTDGPVKKTLRVLFPWFFGEMR